MPFLLLILGRVSLKDWLYIAIIAGILGSVLYFRHEWIKQGHDEAIADIQAANAKAQSNADQGIKDVAACYDAGGTWDRDNGVCVTPAR